MAGRRVRFTPKGYLVIVRQRRISFRRSSGVGWVRAVNYTWSGTTRTRDSERSMAYNSQATCIANSTGKLCIADPLHTALDDRHY
jgi:hypothetical protein